MRITFRTKDDSLNSIEIDRIAVEKVTDAKEDEYIIKANRNSGMIVSSDKRFHKRAEADKYVKAVNETGSFDFDKDDIRFKVISYGI